MSAELEEAEERAIAAADYIVESQRPEGHWPYPNPEWRGRVATVEGCFAGIGLLETYRQTGAEKYVDAARRWYRYVIDVMGFQPTRAGLAVNYFANLGTRQVPNNSTLLLQFLAELWATTHDEQYLETAAPMVSWLNDVQLDTGELPYGVLDGTDGSDDRIHFLCYQYNAFEFMDLVTYHRLTGDDAVKNILTPLAEYLGHGLTRDGAAKYDCHHDRPEVNYYTLAIAQALSQATQLGLGDYDLQTARAYERVLATQRADGGFAYHSRANYGFLSDRRSYPRYLSMMLYHLLLEYRRLREPQVVTASD